MEGSRRLDDKRIMTSTPMPTSSPPGMSLFSLPTPHPTAPFTSEEPSSPLPLQRPPAARLWLLAPCAQAAPYRLAPAWLLQALLYSARASAQQRAGIACKRKHVCPLACSAYMPASRVTGLPRACAWAPVSTPMPNADKGPAVQLCPARHWHLRPLRPACNVGLTFRRQGSNQLRGLTNSGALGLTNSGDLGLSAFAEIWHMLHSNQPACGNCLEATS